MTAAKIMDVIARLPACDGQAADPVSAYTQVKLEDAPKLLKIPKSECPDVWSAFHDTNGQNHGKNEDLVILLERNLYGHPLPRLLWGQRESTELGMHVRSSETRVISVRKCG